VMRRRPTLLVAPTRRRQCVAPDSIVALVRQRRPSRRVVNWRSTC